MKLWTIQHYQAYEKLLETGILRADENHIFHDELAEEVFRRAYDWMSKKMIEARLAPPKNVRYPIWAWYQWEGKRKRRDMRESGYAMRGEKIVQLTIEVDDADVLLSDFDLFHYVLNYWYLPSDEKDKKEFEREYADHGFKWKDWLDFNIQTEETQNIRAKIEKSWDRVFDLEKEDDDYVCYPNSQKSIQAIFWQLKAEQVLKAEMFTARGREVKASE